MKKTKRSRIEKYNLLSNTLACMSNMQLQSMVSDGFIKHRGIGGSSVEMEIDNIPVFVKKVPVTEFELQAQNFMSTKNIFNLPMCYQYGIGSAGFGAWRELAAHIATTNWVITRKCQNFPIMYHCRIMHDSLNNEDLTYWGSQDDYMDIWENDKNIKFRIESLKKSSSCVLIFLEHFPHNLYQHLNEIISKNQSNNHLNEYLKQLDSSFKHALDFMKSNDFLHMDAHFHNVLVDDDSIYLSDFGLALFNKFDLSKMEKSFFEQNINYDRCSYSSNIFHAILTSFIPDTDWDKWDKVVIDYYNSQLSLDLSNNIKKILSSHAELAKEMLKFYKKIHKDKSVAFPSLKLRNILNREL